MNPALYEYGPPLDLTNARLRKLAAALGPAYVRVSGTWANTTYFPDVRDRKPNVLKLKMGRLGRCGCAGCHLFNEQVQPGQAHDDPHGSAGLDFVHRRRSEHLDVVLGRSLPDRRNDEVSLDEVERILI